MCAVVAAFMPSSLPSLAKPQWLLEGRPSPTGRYTFSTWRLWTKDSPLLESGLLGPVRLATTEVAAAE
jgi:hypothetical protein